MKKKKIYSLPVQFDLSSVTRISDLISKFTVSILYKGKNRNGSYFAEDVINDMTASIGGLPIVGKWDAENNDFLDHGSLSAFVDENGNLSLKKESLPAYGFVSETPNLRWETRLDKDGVERDYLCADGYLWTGRYSELKTLEDGLNNQSMELNPDTSDGEWCKIDENDETEYFKFSKAELIGLCILGKGVEPCFEGANFKPNFTASLGLAETLKQMKEELQFALSQDSTEEVEETQEESAATVEEPAEDFIVESDKDKKPQGELEDMGQVDDNDKPQFEPIGEPAADHSLEEATSEESAAEVTEESESEAAAEETKEEFTMEDYSKALADLSEMTKQNIELKKSLTELEEKVKTLTSQLDTYLKVEERNKKMSVLEKFKEDLEESDFAELVKNIDEYTEETLSIKAQTLGYAHLKKICDTYEALKDKDGNKNISDFTLGASQTEPTSIFEDGSWESAVARKQKEKEKN